MNLYKIFLVFFIALVLSIIIFIFSFPAGGGGKFVFVEIGAKTLLAETVSTPYDRAAGLSKRKNLADFGGMIFLFGEPGYYAFWMKDMRFPIDIFWIHKGIIVDLEEYAMPPRAKTQDALLLRYEPDVIADTVLETKAGFASRNNIRIGDTVEILSQANFPSKKDYFADIANNAGAEAVFKPSPAPTVLRKVLKIDFSSQAPLDDWDNIHEEACEETDILMTDYFLRKDKFSPEEFDRELVALVSRGKNKLGQHEDIGVDDIVKLANDFNPELKAESKKILSLDDIKKEIDGGLPVIIPINAKKLANPHYGPAIDYHTILVVGYSDKEIITHDSGTKFGKNYRYPNDKFWEVISDLHTGEKNVAVFRPN
mgnify:CR=1